MVSNVLWEISRMRFASCTIWGPDIGTQLLTNSACIRDSMSHFFTHAAPASNKTRTSTPSFWPPVGCSGPAICKLAACRIQNMHVGSTTQGASSPLMGNHFSFFFYSFLSRPNLQHVPPSRNPWQVRSNDLYTYSRSTRDFVH